MPSRSAYASFTTTFFFLFYHLFWLVANLFFFLLCLEPHSPFQFTATPLIVSRNRHPMHVSSRFLFLFLFPSSLDYHPSSISFAILTPYPLFVLLVFSLPPTRSLVRQGGTVRVHFRVPARWSRKTLLSWLDLPVLSLTSSTCNPSPSSFNAYPPPPIFS